MDRFLSASLSLPVSPYCLAAGCILIASKLSECENVTADTLCAAAEYGFVPSNLRVSQSHSIHRWQVHRNVVVQNHAVRAVWELIRNIARPSLFNKTLVRF